MTPLLRFVPEQPLPPYSYVPGRFPHPVSDPAGHSHGIAPSVPAPLDPDQWHTNKTYLYGIDLFNYQFYWESHVAFESLWLNGGACETTRAFLKGLIKLAAAGVKHLQGVPAGVQSHSCRAAVLFAAIERPLFLGLELKELQALAETICRAGWPSAPPVLCPKE